MGDYIKIQLINRLKQINFAY